MSQISLKSLRNFVLNLPDTDSVEDVLDKLKTFTNVAIDIDTNNVIGWDKTKFYNTVYNINEKYTFVSSSKIKQCFRSCLIIGKPEEEKPVIEKNTNEVDEKITVKISELCKGDIVFHSFYGHPLLVLNISKRNKSFNGVLLSSSYKTDIYFKTRFSSTISYVSYNICFNIPLHDKSYLKRWMGNVTPSELKRITNLLKSKIKF